MQLIIQESKGLSGEIPVYGSKNAALPLLAATLLTKEEVTLRNIPAIRDVDTMCALLSSLGADVRHMNDVVSVKAENIDEKSISPDAVGALRGSILLLGALLGRGKHVSLPRPGGDIIGARPIDAHLDAFAQLGAKVTVGSEVVEIDGSTMKSGTVVLKEFSVTATENYFCLPLHHCLAKQLFILLPQSHTLLLFVIYCAQWEQQ
jgi:UDP-N-acetylglucosamine 1-carboxyvinyltransferase